MIIYQLIADRDRLLKIYPDAVVIGGSADITGILQRWDAGKLQIILANPKSCGHGLNAQKAPRGGIQIWISGTWSSELLEQTVGRIYRPGAPNHCHIYMIAAKDTIDAAVLSVMDRKINAQELIKLALAERKAMHSAPDLAAELKAARRAVQQAHPDRGGDEKTFIAAWKKYEALKARI